MKGHFIALFFFVLFISHLMPTESLAASEEKKRVLISVGDLKDNQDLEWKKSMCKQVYELANSIVDSNGVDVTCRSFDTANFLDEELQKLMPLYDFHLRVLKNLDGTIGIDVTNLQRTHQSDFKTLGWTFRDGEKSKVTKEQAMARALGNLFFYVGHQEAFKAGLLVNGMSESNNVALDEKNNVFVEKTTNQPITIDRAYSIFENESARKKNYLRAGVEIGVMLSSAMAGYYTVIAAREKKDFDYSFGEGIRKKLNGQGIRFDDNDKFDNEGHKGAGVMYYQAGRSNGMNSLESFLIALASSTSWEFIEYHEVLSINDEILTPVGGYIIGEAGYQVACALLQKNNAVATTLGYLAAPALGVNQTIDRVKSKNKYKSQPDCKKTRWSDISMYIGLENGQKAYDPAAHTAMAVGFDATVVTIPNYAEEGKESKVLFDTSMAKLLVEANGNQGAIDLKVVAQVVSAAYYQKNLTKDEKGQLRGYDLLLGVGSASTWSDRGTRYTWDDEVSTSMDDNEDFFGTVNILGATAHANVNYHGYNIKADIAFYGDFAMVKSYSLNEYKKGPEGLKGEATTISGKGYYWGWGSSTLASISAQKGRWTVGASGQISNETSINGHHRFEEQITKNTKFKDSLKSGRLYVNYRLTKNLTLQIAREFDVRESTIDGGFANSGTEKRTRGSLIYKF
jgi:hypothetical protein